MTTQPSSIAEDSNRIFKASFGKYFPLKSKLVQNCSCRNALHNTWYQALHSTEKYT